MSPGRDDIAAAIEGHRESYDSDCCMYYGCRCGWDNETEDHNDGYAEHVADAVLALFTPADPPAPGA